MKLMRKILLINIKSLKKEEKEAIILPSIGIIIAIFTLIISTILHILIYYHTVIGLFCLIVTLAFIGFGVFSLWKVRKRYGRTDTLRIFCYSFSLLFLVGGLFVLIFVLSVSWLTGVFTNNALSTLWCSVATIVLSFMLLLGGLHYKKKIDSTVK